MDLYANLTPRVSSAKSCRGIKCIKWGGKEDDCITMPSSLDYLGRSWGVKTQKVWGVRCSAVAGREMHNKCGRGANRGQKLLARCEQRTKIFCPWHLYARHLSLWARNRTGSDWIRTEANFGRIKTGSDCIFLKICGSGLNRTEIILLVFMWLF